MLATSALLSGYILTVAVSTSAGVTLTAFVVLRAFAAGCAALTGVEAIADGVPAFQEPQSQNAA